MWSNDTLERLNDTASLASEYNNAKPFPHIVLDNVLDPYTVKKIHDTFPKPNASWWKYDNALERKFAKDDLSSESVFIRDTMSFLQSKPFVDVLEQVTGISGLITDHTLRGGGLHAITTGGKLDVHCDYNVHPHLKLQRRVNVLLYVNFNWKDAWRGHLELWNNDMSACVHKISPVFNRMVIFTSTDTSYHGHPDPLLCPEGMTRKSMATYYYTVPTEEHLNIHSTIYKARPQDAHDAALELLRQQRAKGRL